MRTARDRPERVLPAWRLVFLEPDDDARAVDLLRAVEGAGEGTLFWPHPTPWETVESLRLPLAPADPADLLIDDLGPPAAVERIFVNALEDGRTIVRRRVLAEDDLGAFVEARRKASFDLAILLRADRGAPWAACRPAVALAARLGIALGLVFADEPGLPGELHLPIPPLHPPPSGWATAPREEDGELDIARDRWQVDQGIRIPGGSTCGAVARLALRLRAEGRRFALE